MGFYSLISDFCPAVGQSSRTEPLHFYEKVIKVKADVAALHIFFLRHQRCGVGWRGELSRAPFLGVHLDP
jgi:hypothetical protein